MRAGQFPAQTVAAVSLFSIMAKDKGNLLLQNMQQTASDDE